MKLINNKEFLKNVAQQIDLLNTLGGGISETQVQVNKYKKGILIRVHAPSVNPELYQVVVDKNKLTVMTLFASEANPDLQVPMFHQVFELPAYANFSKIKAVFENGELQVRVPFLAKGPRLINIEME
ncbi:MAG: Hsp20/alpha crystallin family protein [Hymenobacteraceae bacterium]|nr:Hsp20/alpha crystallin family protein [Hymenobacteraceae bacterium]MDX5396898.1 Hsp20/alpha crystallin family protein [Hymenobacteraceae bacterium]MDX5442747.1 Hsp20/alpha crystallin family protein [Hymenobacteraceae bacterium]MDX5512972.1 Hsp20/alpha crystallin family protein [Hymenobacteraceae bacterium]